ncbi:MAG: endonuclease VII domain-containing protein [Candidatus Lokiarchaeota archaeon]|nr:endonuclease VII domain-containing protein [Candidatus Lokiarchaeota archaeon]
MTINNENNLKNIGVDIKTKKCPKCKKVLPASPVYFYRRKGAKFGLDSYCKECLRIYYTIRSIKKRYGISKNQFEQILKKQNYSCAICGQKFVDLFHPHNKKSFTYHASAPRVDHNHKTGEIRGLLCDRCNLLIGEAHENTLVLVNAIKYLRKEV